MRFKLRPYHKKGDQRTIKTFCWIPKTINRERRWLEKSVYLQYYSDRRFDSGWKDEKWLN